MDTSGFGNANATPKHAQTTAMIEMSHQQLKQILKIIMASNITHFDRYVNLAVMA